MAREGPDHNLNGELPVGGPNGGVPVERAPGEYYYKIAPDVTEPHYGGREAERVPRTMSLSLVIGLTSFVTAAFCLILGFGLLVATGALKDNEDDPYASTLKGQGAGVGLPQGNNTAGSSWTAGGVPDYVPSPPSGSASTTSSSVSMSESHTSTTVDIPNTGETTVNEPVSDGSLTISQISKKVIPSVVGIISESSSYFGTNSTGSGIIMDETGYIITNAHVISGAEKLSVVLYDGTTYGATVVGSDTKTDLAVIKINAKNLAKAEFGNSDALEVGDLAVAIGNPFGMELQSTTTAGIISGINRNLQVDDSRIMKLIQTDASINYGNSGGALANKYGQVIGINSLKIGDTSEGLGFAIPINAAKSIIDELIQYGKVKNRAAIGIQGVLIPQNFAEANGLPVGLQISSFTREEPITAGLHRGDIITDINGVAITSIAIYNEEKSRYKAGERITLTIYRDSDLTDGIVGNTLNIDTVLVEEN